MNGMHRSPRFPAAACSWLAYLYKVHDVRALIKECWTMAETYALRHTVTTTLFPVKRDMRDSKGR